MWEQPSGDDWLSLSLISQNDQTMNQHFPTRLLPVVVSLFALVFIAYSVAVHDDRHFATLDHRSARIKLTDTVDIGGQEIQAACLLDDGRFAYSNPNAISILSRDRRESEWARVEQIYVPDVYDLAQVADGRYLLFSSDAFFCRDMSKQEVNMLGAVPDFATNSMMETYPASDLGSVFRDRLGNTFTACRERSFLVGDQRNPLDSRLYPYSEAVWGAIVTGDGRKLIIIGEKEIRVLTLNGLEPGEQSSEAAVGDHGDPMCSMSTFGHRSTFVTLMMFGEGEDRNSFSFEVWEVANNGVTQRLGQFALSRAERQGVGLIDIVGIDGTPSTNPGWLFVWENGIEWAELIRGQPSAAGGISSVLSAHDHQVVADDYIKAVDYSETQSVLLTAHQSGMIRLWRLTFDATTK